MGLVRYCTCGQLGHRQEDQRRLEAPLPGTNHGKWRICSVSPDAPSSRSYATSHMAVKSAHTATAAASLSPSVRPSVCLCPSVRPSANERGAKWKTHRRLRSASADWNLRGLAPQTSDEDM